MTLQGRVEIKISRCISPGHNNKVNIGHVIVGRQQLSGGLLSIASAAVLASLRSATSMSTSTQKRRLRKSLSHDVTGAPPFHLQQQTSNSSSSSITGSTSIVSTDEAKDGRLIVRREEFICSDGHNTHLEEDYLEDESRLFGRQISSASSSRRNLKASGSSSCRRTLRKLLKSKSVDTHSVKSLGSTVNDESADERPTETVTSITNQPNHVEVSSATSKATSCTNSLPRKPPRKHVPGFSVDPSSVDDRRRSTIVPVHEMGNQIHAEEKWTNGKARPPLLRRDSVIRPLECEVRPRLYSRQSITHVDQFTQESAVNESVTVEGETTATTNHQGNGDIVAGCPERPQRSRRHSQLVKRESVIHPSRPPSNRQRQPLTSALYQPLIVNGRFQNPWSTWKRPSFVGSLRWTFTSKDNSSVPNSSEELDKALPVIPLCAESVSQPPVDGIRVTWLGHATVLVQFGDITVLTDPMFSERASPLGFFGPKRIRRFPGTVYDLPKLDAVVISHNHYDHLDYNSVLLLNARFGADLHWFVPVGLRTWMHNAGCKTVTELTWWAEGTLHHTDDVSFYFTPAQHWSKRTPSDDNKVLWGSWCILGPRYRFFFAGDTGYCDAFKQIGDQFGPFDLAAIPIGAYEPRWFMHNQHIDPSEAVKLHQDIKAYKSLGIHWGTFILTNEHYLEPPLKLAECVRHAGLSSDDFFVLKHGESRLVCGS